MTQARAVQLCDWDSPLNPTFNSWTTVNLAEVFPGVAHPFDATWYHRWQTNCFRALFARLDISDLMPLYEFPIPNFLGFWAGQCAANVSFTTAFVSAYQTGAGSSVVEQFFTADEKGAHTAATAADTERASQLRTRVLRIWGQLPRSAVAMRGTVRRLVDRVEGQDLSGLPEPVLIRQFARVEALAQRTFTQHILTSFAAGEQASMLGDLLRSAGVEDEDAVLALTSAIGDVESAEPPEALWALSRWVRAQPGLAARFSPLSTDEITRYLDVPPDTAWASLAARVRGFLEAYGHRGPEWMLSLPDWAEDPAVPLNSLRAMVQAADSDGPDRRRAGAAGEREAAVERYRTRLPARRRARFDSLVDRAQRFVRLRERTKATCVMGLRPGRQILLALGEHFHARGVLDSADDIFYLFANEVDAVVDGRLTKDEARNAVRRRRRQKIEMEAYLLPDNFEGRPEIQLRGEAPEPSSVLQGLGVSPGLVTGRARVMADLAAAGETPIHPGEVLVAPFTDAPWTPLFLTAAAVVVETGGMLSHAATVAREFGIPAVVMVKDATRLIETGEELTVDGRTGRVVVAAG
ncbi:MAG TPA: PEP-utilizing enzyme [Dehalococcoidia bacterium]|nr:PEP-utilizing enzyme [Dehalococcoidia bacterium]